MRRAVVAMLLAMCLSAVAVGTVAAKPDKGCSEGHFSAFAVNWVWEYGDGLPEPGEDAWWDMTVAGFAAAGETPESIAELFGLGGDAEALYELIVGALRGLDRNGDGWICSKPFPEHQKGSLPYYFNAIDNNARQH